jgi:hypothetical protein
VRSVSTACWSSLVSRPGALQLGQPVVGVDELAGVHLRDALAQGAVQLSALLVGEILTAMIEQYRRKAS